MNKNEIVYMRKLISSNVQQYQVIAMLLTDEDLRQMIEDSVPDFVSILHDAEKRYAITRPVPSEIKRAIK